MFVRCVCDACVMCVMQVNDTEFPDLVYWSSDESASESASESDDSDSDAGKTRSVVCCVRS